MFKILKIILISLISFESFAEYSAKIPLEISNGGSLPNGSINFSNTPIVPPSTPNYSTDDFSQNTSNAICRFNAITPEPWDNHELMETWYITLAGSPPRTWSGYVAKTEVNGFQYQATMPMYSAPQGPFNISGIEFFPGALRLVEYESKTDNFRVWAPNLTTYSLDDYYIVGQHYEICYRPD